MKLLADSTASKPNTQEKFDKVCLNDHICLLVCLTGVMLLTLTRLLAFQKQADKQADNAVKIHGSAANTLAASKAKLASVYEKTKRYQVNDTPGRCIAGGLSQSL